MRKVLILAAIFAVAGLAAPPSRAACGDPLAMTNFNGYGVINCPDLKPVIGYSYQPGAPTATNTSTVDIICEEDLGFAPCNTMPGFNSAGDNTVGISTDWSTPGVLGCPTGRVVIILQCNDGRGAVLSLGGGCAALGYNPEAAFNFDGANLPTLDVLTQNNGRPLLQGFSRSGGMDTFDVQVDPPTLQSDCTPGTYGDFFGVQGYCTPDEWGPNCSNLPTLARGKLYSRTEACNTATNPTPTTKARASWTLQALDAAGHAMVALPTPAAGMCNFLGTSLIASGFETDFITGFVVAGDPTAASPVAEAVRATKKGNSVEVTFRTSSELGLAGFNIYAAGKAKGEVKLNSALIAATGVGGAGSSYIESFGVADFKGSRSVIVESVLADGTTLRAPKADF